MNVFSRASKWAIASHNAGKIKEIADLIGSHGIQAEGAQTLGLPEPEETEKTFVGNALLKAKAGSTASGLVALADDSGLEVTALGGAPGIYSARWAGEPRDFNRAMERIRTELEALGTSDYSARFVCVLALAHPDGDTATFEGEVRGTLSFPARGANGFGYDPIFMPEGHSRTFAEMEASEKKSMSHRARAFERMIAGVFSP